MDIFHEIFKEKPKIWNKQCQNVGRKCSPNIIARIFPVQNAQAAKLLAETYAWTLTEIKIKFLAEWLFLENK